MSSRQAPLKEKLQCKVHLPRGRGGAGDRSRRSRQPGGGKDNEIGRVEIGPVQQVEDLRTKLQGNALTQVRVLNGGKVPGRQAGAVQVVPRGVAEESTVGWRLKKSSGGEPLRGRADNRVAGEIWIGELPDGIT